jgi:hypothetical protein
VGAFAVIALVGTASPAFAAGSGYGPGALLPAGVPGGFRSVIAASTFGQSGGTFKLRDCGGTCSILVPRGAFRSSLQIVITKASTAAVNANLRNKVVVCAVGIVFDKNGHALNTLDPLQVDFTSAKVSSRDAVVEYRNRAFRPVISEVHGNTIAFKLVSGITEAAIVSPKVDGLARP